MAVPFLRQMCICIAIFEILHAFYFIIQSIIWLQDDVDAYDSCSLVSSIIWLVIAIGLLVGILNDFYKFIVIWLVFAVCGVIIDVCFLAYIANLGELDWDEDRGVFLLFAAIGAEVLCVVFMTMYYLNVSRDDTTEIMQVLGESTIDFREEAMLQKKERGMSFNLNEKRKQKNKHKPEIDLLSLLRWNEPSAPRAVNKKRHKEKRHHNI